VKLIANVASVIDNISILPWVFHRSYGVPKTSIRYSRIASQWSWQDGQLSR